MSSATNDTPLPSPDTEACLDADCSSGPLHEKRVEAARRASPAQARLADLGELFKVFSDPTRLRILSALTAGELCVRHLGEAVGMSQSAVSHQLAILRQARLVRARRLGKEVYYALDDEHVSAILAVGLDHVGEGGRA
jgi:DNA-binding transcriptional ArsR family regulator